MARVKLETVARSTEIGTDPTDSSRPAGGEVNCTLIFCRRAFHFLLAPLSVSQKETVPYLFSLRELLFFIDDEFKILRKSGRKNKYMPRLNFS